MSRCDSEIAALLEKELDEPTSATMQAHIEYLLEHALKGIEPEIKRLADLHRGRGVADWATTLRNAYSAAIRASIPTKLKLQAEAYEHEFFWPEPGTTYDDQTMDPEYRPHADQKASRVVAYTRRPGLRIRSTKAQELKVVIYAAVSTRSVG